MKVIQTFKFLKKEEIFKKIIFLKRKLIYWIRIKYIKFLIKNPIWLYRPHFEFKLEKLAKIRTKNILKLKPLAPIVSNQNQYSDTLLWAINHNEINNIALTGSYGSGKSSILKQFVSKLDSKTFLNVSLATFLEAESDEVDVEFSILKQFFYKESHKTLSNSRFKKIKKHKYLGLRFLFFISFLYSILHIYFYDLTIKHIVLFSTPAPKYIIEIFCIIGFILIGYNIFKFFISSKVQKINLGKKEFEMGLESNDSSALHKHIDEILYFFEETQYRIIIFEDIDRFKNSEKLFTKLRELNFLLNNSLQLKRHFVFIYAIRDDVFDSKNRTKFFELIVPIVPFINSSNSKAKLIEALNSIITEKAIKDVSFLIDDMRLLTNIVNEFKIYIKTLNENISFKDKMFFLIVFKNLFPQEFQNLQAGKGIIYELFAQKEDLVKIITSELEEKRIKLEEKISDSNKEKIIDLKELRAIYGSYIFTLSPEIAQIQINYQNISLKDLIDSEKTFNDLIINKIVFFKDHPTYRNNQIQITELNKTFSQIENEINPEISYLQRKENIENKSTEKLEKIKDEIKNTEFEINKIKNNSLSYLLLTNNLSKLLVPQTDELIKKYYPFMLDENANKFKNDIIYFLENGLIDEFYNDYITFFHTGSISTEDNKFRKMVKYRQKLPFNYKLNKIDNLIEELDISDFENGSILNFDLLNHLIQNDLKYKEYLNKIFLHPINNYDFSIPFFHDYYAECVDKQKYVAIISKSWAEFWRFVISGSFYNQETKDEILVSIFNTESINTIENQNSKDDLLEYIDNHESIINILNKVKNYYFVINVLNTIELKLENISISDTSDSKLIHLIYVNNLYKVNFKNLLYILNNFNNKTDNILYYSKILNSKEDNFIQYVNSNINDYVIALINSGEGKDLQNLDIEYDYFIALLNNDKVDILNKFSILKLFIFQIKDLNIIDLSLWGYIIENNKLISNWSNVLNIYKNKKTKALIVNLLNEEIFCNDLIQSELNENDVLKSFFESMINSFESISINSFEKIFKICPYKFENLNDIGYPTQIDKIRILYKLNLVGYSKIDLEEFEDPKYNNFHLNYIEMFYLEFMDDMDLWNNYVFDNKTVIFLLNSSKPLIDKKEILEHYILENISIEDAETIIKILIENKIQKPTFLEPLLIFSKNEKLKLQLLLNHWEILNKDEILNLLKHISKLSNIQLNKNNLQLIKNEENKNILLKLQEKLIVNNFNIDLKDNTKYKFTTKKY